jgi:hypothetical protein
MWVYFGIEISEILKTSVNGFTCFLKRTLARASFSIFVLDVVEKQVTAKLLLQAQRIAIFIKIRSGLVYVRVNDYLRISNINIEV